eukprot:1160515-Pelagomonas_calceolata.AAC.2
MHLTSTDSWGTAATAAASAAAVAAGLGLIYLWSKPKRRGQQAPGPRGWPIVGHAPAMLRPDVHRLLVHVSETELFMLQPSTPFTLEHLQLGGVNGCPKNVGYKQAPSCSLWAPLNPSNLLGAYIVPPIKSTALEFASGESMPVFTGVKLTF